MNLQIIKEEKKAKVPLMTVYKSGIVYFNRPTKDLINVERWNALELYEDDKTNTLYIKGVIKSYPPTFNVRLSTSIHERLAKAADADRGLTIRFQIDETPIDDEFWKVTPVIEAH